MEFLFERYFGGLAARARIGGAAARIGPIEVQFDALHSRGLDHRWSVVGVHRVTQTPENNYYFMTGRTLYKDPRIIHLGIECYNRFIEHDKNLKSPKRVFLPGFLNLKL